MWPASARISKSTSAGMSSAAKSATELRLMPSTASVTAFGTTSASRPAQFEQTKPLARRSKRSGRPSGSWHSMQLRSEGRMRLARNGDASRLEGKEVWTSLVFYWLPLCNGDIAGSPDEPPECARIDVVTSDADAADETAQCKGQVLPSIRALVSPFTARVVKRDGVWAIDVDRRQVALQMGKVILILVDQLLTLVTGGEYHCIDEATLCPPDGGSCMVDCEGIGRDVESATDGIVDSGTVEQLCGRGVQAWGDLAVEALARAWPVTGMAPRVTLALRAAGDGLRSLAFRPEELVFPLQQRVRLRRSQSIAEAEHRLQVIAKERAVLRLHRDGPREHQVVARVLRRPPQRREQVLAGLVQIAPRVRRERGAQRPQLALRARAIQVRRQLHHPPQRSDQLLLPLDQRREPLHARSGRRADRLEIERLRSIYPHPLAIALRRRFGKQRRPRSPGVRRARLRLDRDGRGIRLGLLLGLRNPQPLRARGLQRVAGDLRRIGRRRRRRNGRRHSDLRRRRSGRSCFPGSCNSPG